MNKKYDKPMTPQQIDTIRNKFPVELKVLNKLTVETFRKTDANQELVSFNSVDSFIESWNR